MRRVIGLVAAGVIASIGVGAQAVPATAPASGTLFGVVSCIGCSSSIDRVDPSTGAEMPLAALNVGALAADPSVSLLYAMTAVGQGKGGGGVPELITMNSQTGATLTTVVGVGALDITVDPATHTLFGLESRFDGQAFSTEIARINPATGASTDIASLPPGERELVFDPASRVLYTQSGEFSIFPPTGRLYTINADTGLVSTTALNRAVFGLAFDTTTGELYGVANPNQFVKINPQTGSETPVGNFAFTSGFPTSVAIDSHFHAIYIVESQFVAGGERQTQIASLNDQTGAGTLGAVTALPVFAIAFQPAPITPDSIRADVQSALSSGAISSAGVAQSLIAKLDAAAAARARGSCATSANVYGAFTNEVNAQSGKAIGAATAAQLVSEANILIANCP